MNINFTNINFEKDINLPENIQTLNNDIKKEIIKSGFIQTNNHIKKYFTEN